MPSHVMHVLEATGGGSRRHLAYLLPALRAAGFAVDFVYALNRADPDFAADLAAFRAAGCHLTPLDLRRDLNPGDLAALWQLRRLVRARRPAVLHSHCGKAGVLARLVAKSLGRGAPAVVHTSHAYYFQGFASPLARCLAIRLERFLSRTGTLFCIAAAEQRTILEYGIAPADRIVVGPNGLPADFAARLVPRAVARARLGLPEDVVAVGVFARLVARKGHKWLLRAIHALPEAVRRQARFVFAGHGPERDRLQARIGELGLAGVVSCPGYVAGAERLLAGLDVGVLPSYYEGLSYQLLETLGAGVPLIASRAPGNAFDLPGNPIQYVPPDDVPALAAALAELIEQPARRAELGRQGRTWVQAHFTLERQLETLTGLYARLVAERRG